MALIDTFNSPNGTSVVSRNSDSGHQWVLPAAGTSMFIDNGRVHANVGFTVRPYSTWVPDSADYSVKFDLYVASVAAGNGVGVMARAAGEVLTGLITRLDADSNSWQLARVVNGTAVSLATAPETVVVGNTYHVETRYNGFLIEVFVNGTGVIAYEDETITDKGTVALYSNTTGSATTGLHIDNILAQPLNQAPEVNAGADQLGLDPWGPPVQLSATEQDIGGSIVSRQWLQTRGAVNVALTVNGLNASFERPKTLTGESLGFTFLATDNEGAIGSDTVNVEILPVGERAVINGVEVPMRVLDV